MLAVRHEADARPMLRLLEPLLTAGDGALGRLVLGRQGFGQLARAAGLQCLESEDLDRAWRWLSLATRLAPDDARAQFFSGMTALGRKDAAEARARFQTAADLDPGSSLAHSALAQMSLPGPGYYDVLRRIHEHLRPRTYLEIGVEAGRSLALALPGTRAIGIDPEPQLAAPPAPGVTVHAMTSEAFFARHDVRAELGGAPIDLAFIDGMHTFESALRDFIEIEKHCTPRSTILFHDGYPLDRTTADRERRTKFWSGDIWRLVLALRKYRPDLSVHTVTTAPTGLGLVRRLDPGSRVLEERFREIEREFLALDYSVLDADKRGMLAAVANDWEQIVPLLS
jgi:hypothetical protein